MNRTLILILTLLPLAATARAATLIVANKAESTVSPLTRPSTAAAG